MNRNNNLIKIGLNFNSHISNINSWSDFKQSLENKTKLEKGKTFEILTKYYLEYNPLYNTKLKKVWLQNEIPSTLFKKLNLPTNDQGIDLIAETIEGDYWAIQCKYLQDEDQTLSHRAISTFISLSTGIANHIMHCLICTTVDDYANLYKGKNNIGFINSDEWRKLDKEFFDWLRAKLRGKILKPSAYKPKPHQQKALKEANEYFVKDKNVRGKLVFPCGAGKSLTGYWITRELKANKILVAVPSLSLVKQTLEVYLRESVANNEKVAWLCVCSDVGVGTNDDIAIHTNEIGVPCVTDKDYISDWLEKNSEGKTVIFTTYQSGKTISEACIKAKFEFDLGILDEAHKTVGDKDRVFSHLLFDKNIKINKRIFMTATERRYSGSSDVVLGMDDEEVYGETFAQMSFKEAIDEGILSDYRIITLFISDDDVKKLIENNAFVKPTDKEWNKETDARTLASLIGLRKAMTDYPIHHAVTFHSSIKKAEAFEQSMALFGIAYPKFAHVDSFHVSGAMPTSFRGKIVDEFANSNKAIITNAKCLTEGVDVPNIDCVLFADPRKSTIDIVQAVGRALRRKEGKTFGYVILPVFTKSKNKEEIIDSDDFKDILSTLRALASNDERIIEYFRDISKGVKTAKKDSLIQFEIGVNIPQSINEKQLIDSLKLKTWDKLAKLSWMPFDEARNFVNELGLKNTNAWRDYCKSKNKPFDIPNTPYTIYKSKGWVSYGDWLGTGKISDWKKEFREFEIAREFARTLNLKSNTEWRIFSRSNKRPTDIPSMPERVYKHNGWISWSDWLGTNNIAKSLIPYLDFLEAKKKVHKLNFKTKSDWEKYCESGNKPIDIPYTPRHVYMKCGWNGWLDWLGIEKFPTRKVVYRDFNSAREFIRKLGLKNQNDWKQYCKSNQRPIDIPSSPDKEYKNNGWLGYGDWIGTDVIASQNKIFRSFEEAKEYVRNVELKNQKDWMIYCKSGNKPKDIPSAPQNTYSSKGWKGFGDWLGNGRIANKDILFKDFYSAREYVRNLGLKNTNHWIQYCKSGNKPSDIPYKPERTYIDKGWKGWKDFLGNDK